MFDYIQVVDGNLCIVEQTKIGPVEKPVGRAIFLMKIALKIETDEILLEIRFKYHDRSVTQHIPRSALTRNKLCELAKFGADIFEHNADIYIKHLKNEELKFKKNFTLQHENVGWYKYDDKKIFRHFKAVGVDSEYCGPLEIEPKGTLEKWKKVISKEVIGNTALELAVVIGLSSVVVSFLMEKFGLDCAFVHVFGNSTTGKTTACQLAISTAGYPDTKQNGLMTTWNATTNALFGHLKNNMGLPVLFDEASVSRIQDFSTAIYTLAQGKEKSRLTKEGELKDAISWSTTIISNGEQSLLGSANQNIGLKVRLIEFADIRWTKSAENAENIKKDVLANYGHAAPELAKYMIDAHTEVIENRFMRIKSEVVEKLGSDRPFVERIANNLAVFVLTSELANEALGLKLDAKKIEEMLLTNEQHQESRDIYSLAFEYFIEVLKSNTHKFYSANLNGSYSPPVGEIWGEITYKKSEKRKRSNTVEIAILPTIFDKIMRDGKFSDAKIILKNWRDKGLLNHEKDRLTRSRRLGKEGVANNVYVILYDQTSDKNEAFSIHTVLREIELDMDAI